MIQNMLSYKEDIEEITPFFSFYEEREKRLLRLMPEEWTHNLESYWPDPGSYEGWTEGHIALRLMKKVKEYKNSLTSEDEELRMGAELLIARLLDRAAYLMVHIQY